MLNFVRKHPVRVYAVLAALMPLVARYAPGLDVETVLAVAGGALGVGELVQRLEDQKTGAGS